MELHFDERLARPIAAVDSFHTGFEGIQQFRQLVEAAAQIRQVNVVGVFDTDGLPTTVVMHLAIIDPTRQAPESLTKAAKLTHQRQLVPLAQVRAIDDAELAQTLGSDFADPMQLADRQAADKLIDQIRCDDKQTVRLLPVTGDLGEKLVRCHTRRHRNVQLIGNTTADVLGDPRGASCEMSAVRHVEVSLIQRQRLDDVGVIAKNRMNFL
ncbi:hypothetical protein D3C84_795240 [compost metagenome]